jgi:hypothetical protein
MNSSGCSSHDYLNRIAVVRGSGRQGRNPADVSSAVLVARVEYVVMPQLTEGNPVFIAWCKRPGCSVEILFGHPPRCLKNIGRLLEATKFTK